jgi:hypothetical protein
VRLSVERLRFYDRRSRPGSSPTPGHERHTMGFFGFLLLGLLAGAIAKLILPGKQAE